MHAENTTFVAVSSTLPLIAQQFGNVSFVYWYGGTAMMTGSVVSGSTPFSISGPNAFMPFAANPAMGGYTSNALGASLAATCCYFPGLLSHLAFYNLALTASQISAHYADRTSVATYDAKIAADGAFVHWPLNESTGSTATDVIGGYNGTYTGGVTLHDAASGVTGDNAPLFDGSTGYVLLPTIPLNSLSTYTVEGWEYEPSNSFGGFDTMFELSNSVRSYWISVDQQNGSAQAVQEINGVPQYAPPSSSSFGQGAWYLWDFVYSSGGMIAYLNGSVMRMGGEVSNSAFHDIYTSGGDIGIHIDGQAGCMCYNQFSNVNAAGQSYGVKIESHSGFTYDANQDQWFGGRFSGPIGLSLTSSNKFSFYGIDLEGDATNAAILNGTQTEMVVGPYLEGAGVISMCGVQQLVLGAGITDSSVSLCNTPGIGAGLLGGDMYFGPSAQLRLP